MARYGSTASSQALAPQTLPPMLKQLMTGQRARTKPTMFVVLHPQCSCSRATLHELYRILQNAGPNAPAVYLLLYRPSRPDPSWDDNGVLSLTSVADHAHTIIDLGGRYAATLRAETSGEVVLYAGDDQLLFQGGVTVARGHEGLSAAEERLQAALNRSTRFSGPTPVFGCSIFDRIPRAVGGAS